MLTSRSPSGPIAAARRSAEHAGDDFPFAAGNQVSVPLVRGGRKVPQPAWKYPLVDLRRGADADERVPHSSVIFLFDLQSPVGWLAPSKRSPKGLDEPMTVWHFVRFRGEECGLMRAMETNSSAPGIERISGAVQPGCRLSPLMIRSKIFRSLRTAFRRRARSFRRFFAFRFVRSSAVRLMTYLVSPAGRVEAFPV